jgi:hypothetical protein
VLFPENDFGIALKIPNDKPDTDTITGLGTK